VLAFNLDNCIRLWDYVAGSVKKTYQGHKNEKFAVGGCFAAMNGEAFVASASEDGNIVLWDVKTKNVLQRIEGHQSVCFWVDVHGDAMVSAGQDHTVKVYGHTKSLENGSRENGGATLEEADPGHAKLHDELPIRHEDVKMEEG
jgi:COMPASS component SWD3